MKSKSKDRCILYASVEVNGNEETSKLYKDLLVKSKINRSAVNLIYAIYITGDIAEQMDKAGYIRNEQGQHNAHDVLKFLQFNKWAEEVLSLRSEEERLGAVDKSGMPISYKDPIELLERVNKFNQSHKGLVANVIQVGDEFNMIVRERNASTVLLPVLVRNRLALWNYYKQSFANHGIDITSIPDSVKKKVNAFNERLPDYLENISKYSLEALNEDGALTLFGLNINTPQVQEVINEFGSIEEAAKFVNSLTTENINDIATPHQRTVLREAIKASQEFNGLNLEEFKEGASDLRKEIYGESVEQSLYDTIKELDEKYHINSYEVVKVNQEINTLSDAVAQAALVLQRKVRETRSGEAKLKLSKEANMLLRDLHSAIIDESVITFLERAAKDVERIDRLLSADGLSSDGSDLSLIFHQLSNIQRYGEIRQEYYSIVSALSNPALRIDGSVNIESLNKMREIATKLKHIFDTREGKAKELGERSMYSLLGTIIGRLSNDESVIAAVKLGAVDSSFFDRYLYSMGRASNPIVAAAGYVVQQAQEKRRQSLNEIYQRIKAATNKLYDANLNSEFMIDKDGFIISTHDYVKFYKARHAAKERFKENGKKGIDLFVAMEKWDKDNMVEEVVDKVNGRVEMVPNKKYKKSMPALTAEQREYYNTMMQIKGEMATLLPFYAQHQYRPIQMNRSTLDALGHAKSLKDVGKALKRVVESIYTVREDDILYNENGQITTDTYDIRDSAPDGTVKQRMPVYFVNKLKDQSELQLNFSTALEKFSAMCLNYDAMASVKDTLEFMQNFVKHQLPSYANTPKDIVDNAYISVFQDLYKATKNSNTSEIMYGFCQQYLYGQYRSPNENKALSKIVDSLVGYTSFKSLATNVKGGLSNYLMGEFQMIIESGAREFYGFTDYVWAHSKLFGKSGVTGEVWDALNETRNSMSKLLCDMFDPMQEDFDRKSNQAFHKSAFRKLLSQDLSFINYSSGEYLIHYVNMYAVLHHEKILLNGKKTCLYNAFEVTPPVDGVSKLKIKDGATLLDGSPITDAYLTKIRNKIRYVNQTTHGAMNREDKGLIYQHWYGRLAMNFRQWMIEHYSRRFRGRHFDYSLQEYREGYWLTVFHLLQSDGSKEAMEQGERVKAIGLFLKDFAVCMLHAKARFKDMSDMEKANVLRARSEVGTLIALIGLSFVLGDPDQHKREFWRRWWIYQVRRMIMDYEASMPLPQAPRQMLTILQSPFGPLNLVNSLLYTLYGPFTGNILETIKTGKFNGDLFETIQSGPNKGENKYWHNVKRNVLPFIKDYEQMRDFSTSSSLFSVFELEPTTRN